MKTADYLQAVRLKINATSDYRVAKAIGVSMSLMSKYTRGLSVPGPLTAFKIAEILGDQPSAVIADLEAERAEKMGKADDAEEWRGILKRIGGAAASVLLAAGLGGMSNADAKLQSRASIDHPIHRIKRKKKKAGWFDGLLPSFAVAF